MAENLKETMNRIGYTVMLIRDFGEAHHLTPRQAHDYLRRYKAMDYMQEYYDVEHTLSPTDTVNTLGCINRQHGGKLA